MLDNSNRAINYLRISVTDLCNLRCQYCMPEDGIPKRQHEDILSVDEIERITRAAVACGVNKVRVTGGEPLVRRGIVEICRRIAAIDGVDEVCLTTNGLLLTAYAAQLKDAGVTRLNLSLDTLRSDRYKHITRQGTLDDAFAGMRAAEAAGFTSTKMNVVLIGGFNEDEIADFVLLTRDRDLQVRFIELMPLGASADWDKSCFLSAESVLDAVPALRLDGMNGVAETYRVPGYKGSVGLIRPMSNHFCAQCNRIRVTADGRLKSCLHSSDEVSLKGLSGQALLDTMRQAILMKPQRHHLSASTPSETARTMNEIGG